MERLKRLFPTIALLSENDVSRLSIEEEKKE
jgi:hypothetical protein